MLQKMRWFQGAALVAVVALSGCGGGGTTVVNLAPVAVSELGQADFYGLKPNRGLGSPAANSLNQPTGSIATNGSVFYIADTNNNRVLGYNSVPATVGASADFVIGQTSLTTNASGGGPSGLLRPTKVAIYGTKLLIVDSGNNRVLIFPTLPTANGGAGLTDFSALGAIAIGQTDLNGGSANGNTTAPTAATLNNPTGAIIAGPSTQSKLYVADQLNHRVLIWNSVPTASGTNADVVLGQPNMTSAQYNCAYANSSALPTDPCDANYFTPSASSLYQPSDVWSDGAVLAVSDTANNRVLFWSQVPSTPHVAATFVLGQTVMTSSVAALGGAASLRAPYGVWSDTGYIFVADAQNNRVLAFNYPNSNGQAATLVFGQGDMTHYTANDSDQNNVSDTDPNTGIPNANVNTLNGPQGVYTYNNRIYVSDTLNRRVMVFNYY